MTQGAWVVSILLGIIAVLFSVAVRLVLTRMTDLHQEAMNHMGELTGEIRALRQEFSAHLRDHAKREFDGSG